MLGTTGELPGAQVAHRAVVAAGRAGGAHERTELHGGGIPPVGRVAVGGHRGIGQTHLGSGECRRRVLRAAHGPGEDPADIGVDDRARVTEGEGGDGRRRVGPDTRQCEQVVVVARDLTVVPLDHRRRRLPQPQRPTGVAEPVPHAHRLAGGVRGEVGRGRPPLEPAFPDRQHPSDRSLLGHHLGEVDAPRRAVGVAPGQVAADLVEPREHGGVQPGTGSGHLGTHGRSTSVNRGR